MVLDLFEIMIFGAVVAATYAVVRGLEGYFNVRRRLTASAAPVAARASPGSLVKRQGVTNPILAWVQSSSSLSDTDDRNKLRRDLAMAGFDNPAAPVWYVIARFTLAIGLPLVFLASQQFVAKP